jgi:hypothetical protein
MCNAYKHSPGCDCGFGPPYANIGVTIVKLIPMNDNQSSTVAQLDLTFPLPEKDLNFIDEKGKLGVLNSATQILQQFADTRFGEGQIKILPVHIKKGSILVGVLLVAAGSTYAFFKDYDNLRKGVLSFSRDISAGSRALYKVVKQKYFREAKRSSNQNMSVETKNTNEDNRYKTTTL